MHQTNRYAPIKSADGRDFDPFVGIWDAAHNRVHLRSYTTQEAQEVCDWLNARETWLVAGALVLTVSAPTHGEITEGMTIVGPGGQAMGRVIQIL